MTKNPTRQIFGAGSFSSLKKELDAFGVKRVVLVTERSSFRKSPHYACLQADLKNYQVESTEAIPENPTIAFAEKLDRSLRAKNVEAVLGIGGGSVLDCAKTVRILLTQEDGALEDYVEKRVDFQHPGLPLIAVPTTAGTGSEVTPYASLQTRTHQKISLTHPWLFPEVALIDPLLTHSLPRYVTACSGLDALSQAIESFWSVHHTPFSETHSIRAISLILENLRNVLEDPSNRKARFAMSLASTEAGLAITQTRTTAVHAVSYPLTTFFEIPHGHACALTLPSFIRYNGPALETHRKAHLMETMGISSWEEAAHLVECLMDEAGLERSLRKLGLNREGIDTVIENGFRSDRVVNNPREVTPEVLREILQKLY